MTATLTSPADVLNAAADYLEVNGWCQGRFGGYKGHPDACIIGALSVVSENDHLHQEARAALESVVGTRILSMWNDTPGRTADEVITALRDAAASLA